MTGLRTIGTWMILTALAAVLFAGPAGADEASAINMGLYGGRVYLSTKSFAESSGDLSVVIEGPCATFYSTDSGANWLPGNEISGLYEIVTASTGDIFSASSFTGVQMSSDGGANWTTLTNPAGAAERIMCIDIDAEDNLYISAESALYSSDDLGVSWTKLSDFPGTPGASSSMAVFTDGSAVFCCHSEILWKYTAAGGLTDAYNPPGLEPTYVVTGGGAVYADQWTRSTDGGSTWYTMTTLSTDFIWPLIVNPSSSDRLYTDGWTSPDAGENWFGVPGGGVFWLGGRVLWVDPNNSSNLYGRNDRGVIACTDGIGWVQLNEGIDSLEVYDAARFADDTDIYLVASFHGLGRTADNGSTWDWIDDADSNVTAVATHGANAYCQGARGFRVSSDYGASFSEETFNLSTTATVTSFYYDSDTSQLYATVSNLEVQPQSGGVYVRTGSTWNQLSFDDIPVNIVTKDEGTYYAGAGNRDGDLPGGIYTSPDGTTWTQVPDLSAEAVWDIYAEGPDIYAGAGNDLDPPSVWFSHDTGASWSEVTLNGAAFGEVKAVMADPDDSITVYAAISNEIFESIDGGTSWSTIYTGEEGEQINVFLPPTQVKSGVRRAGGKSLLYFGARTGFYDLQNAPSPSPTPEGFQTPTPAPSPSPTPETGPSPTSSPATTPTTTPTTTTTTTTTPTAGTTTTAAVIAHYVIDFDDYDGDGATDAAVFNDGNWEIQNVGSSSYGSAGDIPVSGDYNGDGTAERACFTSAGLWHVDGVYSGLAWGAGGQIPVPADYDGDGSTDPATYSPTSGNWYIYPGTTVQYGGRPGDIPVPGDYDGDGTADRALYRWVEDEQGKWYVDGVGIFAWGGSADDVPVPMDYDGDGVTDPTFVRNLGGTHFLWKTIAGNLESWGIPDVDTPLTADFNGDGAGEVATWRPHRNKWFARNAGFTYRLTFGGSDGIAAVGQSY